MFKRRNAVKIPKSKILLVVVIILFMLVGAALFGLRSQADEYLLRIVKKIESQLGTRISISGVKIEKDVVSIEGILIDDGIKILISNIDFKLNLNPLEGDLGKPSQIYIGKIYSKFKISDLPKAVESLKKFTANKELIAKAVKRYLPDNISVSDNAFLKKIELGGGEIVLTDETNKNVLQIKSLKMWGDISKLNFSTGNIIYGDAKLISSSQLEYVPFLGSKSGYYPLLADIEVNGKKLEIQGELAKDFNELKVLSKFRDLGFLSTNKQLPLLVLGDTSSFVISVKLSNLTKMKYFTVNANIIARNIGLKHPSIAKEAVIFPKIKLLTKTAFDSEYKALNTKGRLFFPVMPTEQRAAELFLRFESSLTNNENDSLPIVELQVELPKSECQMVKDAIPASFISNLEPFKFIGSAHVEAYVRLPLSNIRDFDFKLGKREFDCKVVSTSYAFSDERLTAQFPLMSSPQEKVQGEKNPDYVGNDKISTYLRAALVASEDSGFYAHRGFELSSLITALKRNLKDGQIVLGGSTITMQMAKNLFLSPERTVSRKVQEIFLAWYLESILSKEKILEIYANIIEYGPGVFGINKAARHFFGKSPNDLTIPEATYLASVLPSPKSRYIYFCRNSLTEDFRGLMRNKIHRMYQLNQISANDLNSSLKQDPKFNPDRMMMSREYCRSDMAINRNLNDIESFRIEL